MLGDLQILIFGGVGVFLVLYDFWSLVKKGKIKGTIYMIGLVFIGYAMFLLLKS